VLDIPSQHTELPQVHWRLALVHEIDIAQRRMLASLSKEELRTLRATVVVFQSGLG
jgi:hypothetical protein